ATRVGETIVPLAPEVLRAARRDYLWGRLAAADRLMRMATRVGETIVPLAPEVLRAARRDVFLAILEEERGELVADPELVPGLVAEVERVLGEEGAARAAAAAGPTRTASG
uniref:hypothetical protein n=1 Tax=Stappia sp. TaxID=1870903 RepID=UPI003A994885